MSPEDCILSRPNLIVGRHDELDVREDVFEQLADLSAVVSVHGGHYIVETASRKSDLRSCLIRAR